METLTYIAVAVAAIAGLGGLVHFNALASTRYGFRFFALKRIVAGAIAVAAIVLGVSGWNVEGGHYHAIAAASSAAGGAVLAGLAIYNVRRTSVAMGLTGSAFELGVYVAAGLFGLVVAIPALLVAVAAAFGRAEPSLRQTHLYHDHDPASAL
ncbi:hypothetical protein [Xanthomonas campestris]|uniref:hypothetical protein n=1 Tax=Xanthomonas campestris TaxID=339 RepID=UPI0035576CB5